MRTRKFIATPEIDKNSSLKFIKLEFETPHLVWSFVQNLEIGKKIEISYGPIKKQRSNLENRYYWGVVIDIIADHTGFSPDEIHEILKHKFLRKQVWLSKEGGVAEGFDITKSTAELSTVEFEKYLSEIRQWASMELGCYIPLPNEAEV